MVDLAKSRYRNYLITFQVMDATNLSFPEDSFDAIFDFGVIHHIPNWKDCINELYRVLKPGGEAILEELSIKTFSKDIGWLWRILFDHPYQQMFSVGQFVEQLRTTGFQIKEFKQFNPLGLTRHFFINASKVKSSHQQSR